MGISGNRTYLSSWRLLEITHEVFNHNILNRFRIAPMGPPQEDIGGLKKDTKALMHYLQDKKDHKEYCPEIDWNQPPLTTYKKNPKSYLPKL